MKTSFSSLQNRVVVITGASSGIGRATARAFSQRGAHVVLAARRERALRTVARECEQNNTGALVVPTDVTNPKAVENLAQQALAAFGRIDVWINNAGVGLFGPFVAADVKTHRRVIETNLFGTMYGAAAVLPHFLRQREGVLITNVSIGGLAPVPFASAYTASKFGMRGFLASLRQELSHVRSIHICGVFPASIDTPGYQHGANVSGVELRPARPVFPPEAVAETMVAVALKPRAEVAVGWPTRLAQFGYALSPQLTERSAGTFIRSYLKVASPALKSQGNLFLPVSAGTGPTGGWQSARTARAPLITPQIVCTALLAMGATLAFGRVMNSRRPALVS